MWFKNKKVIQFNRMLSLDSIGELKTRKAIYEFFEPDNLLSMMPYWVGESPILHLPHDILVMAGGHFYSSQSHPFLKALFKGRIELEKFYEQFSPNNILDMYGLEPEGLLGEDLPPWEIPWLFRNRVAPSPEGSLGREHGVSFYGPVSKEKIELEMSRLISVVKSIKKKGYIPSVSGHIEGFFLKNNNEYRFFILGGKHRAAALIFLKNERIPVRIRSTVPKVVDINDASNWPLVKSKVMSEALAKKVFNRYFSCSDSLKK